ncbi:MAG: hypothetical protein IJ871_02055 [Ruminococcus sp.]|nr:hypothetical protein [Ruminococcus sp.]
MKSKQKKDVALYKKIWCKIRYYQQLNDLSNEDLAAFIGVSERTLSEYDKNAQNITLGKIENFLKCEEIDLEELMEL